jgi:hypothetical protein
MEKFDNLKMEYVLWRHNSSFINRGARIAKHISGNYLRNRWVSSSERRLSLLKRMKNYTSYN